MGYFRLMKIFVFVVSAHSGDQAQIAGDRRFLITLTID
jgi:hypothetical protein